MDPIDPDNTLGRYVLDERGEPRPEPDLLTWGRWMEKRDRIVKQEDPIPGVRVSTVFLGLDHSWNGGPPVLWETMIFGGPHDGYQDRYTSRAQAEKGHRRAIELVIEGEEPPK